jgi:hypothetical protein
MLSRIDQAGHLVIDFRFSVAGDFSEGLAAVRIDDRWGHIDKRGELVIGVQLDLAESFSEGLAAVCVDGEWERLV